MSKLPFLPIDWRFLIVVCVSFGGPILLPESEAEDLQSAIDFSRDIRPILADNCLECHGPDEKSREADLRLDLESAAKASRDGSRAVVAGDSSASTLVQRILSEDEGERMPPPDSGKQLTAEQRKLLVRWVETGAKWSEHWSFQRPQRPQLPVIRNAQWAQNPIDLFVGKRLEDLSLKPNEEARRELLIRRVTLDLTGLPPSPAQVREFVSDESPDAYERLVDRLLDSPRYGERMAVPWLDAARYSDTSGYQSDGPRSMWRWRDWVIDALNANMPYDRFTIDQLAGDLLPNSRLSQKIATGFNRNHRGNAEGGIIPEEYKVEYVVDRVDTTFTIWQGLTIGCARCHDHKYDPISQREYYQLFSYFNNLEEMGRVLKEGNSPPYVQAPTDLQRRQLLELTGTLISAERRFKELNSAIRSAQRRWEAGAPVVRGDWVYSDGMVSRVSADEPDTRGDYRFGDGIVGDAIRTSKGEDIQLDGQGEFGYFDKFTISLGVKPVNGVKSATLVSRMIHVPEDRGYWVQLRDGHIQVNLVKRWLDDSIRVESERKLASEGWQHIAVTYDGTRKASGVKLYVDGKPWRLKVKLDSINQSFQTDGPLRVGGGTDYFEGWVDEFRLYDRALTKDEIGILATLKSVGELAFVEPKMRRPAESAKLRAYYLDVVASKEHRETHQQLISARRELSSFQESIPTVMIMQESEPRPTFVLQRGRYDVPGEEVEPGVPVCLPPMANVKQDRLSLARWLCSDENPLTARVTINRHWQLFFGRGLVATPEDFGVQGKLPTHPKLLDWLATEFTRREWDVKAMQRLIVTSATYRQSSRLTNDKLSKDPANLYYSRGPRNRLSAEVIRDQALAASGLLVEQLGGPSVRPYQPKGLWKDIASDSDYNQDTGAGLYRRSLYTYWKRTVTPPTMASFDASSREACTVSRSRTNTPLQALVLMNERTFMDAARALAARVILEPDDGNRIKSAFGALTAREPRPGEYSVLAEAVKRHRSYFADHADEVEALLEVPAERASHPDAIDHAAYTVVCSMLLNLDEVISKQ